MPELIAIFGNSVARKHIIAAAEKNSPDAPWTEAMRKRHVMDLDNWQERFGTSEIGIFIKETLDHPNGKFIGIAMAAVILLLVYYLGGRSAQARYPDVPLNC